MRVIRNLLNSEKAVVAGVPVVGATVLAALGRISIPEWMDFVKWMASFYISGKAIQGAASQWATAKTAELEREKLRAGIAANDAAADQRMEEFDDKTTISPPPSHPR